MNGPVKASGVYNKRNHWLLWAGVILMLLAMFAYIISLDESAPPGEGGVIVPGEAPAGAP